MSLMICGTSLSNQNSRAVSLAHPTKRLLSEKLLDFLTDLMTVTMTVGLIGTCIYIDGRSQIKSLPGLLPTDLD